MELWLLRHAKSSWDEPELADDERPLAPRGERAAEVIGAFLRDEPIDVDLVLCSSALRARQTLGRVLPALGPTLEVRIDPACYTFAADALLARIAEVPDDVASLLLVGHNPAMQELVPRVADRGAGLDDVRRKLPTGALVGIAFDGTPWSRIAERPGIVTRFVTPKELDG